MSTYAFDMIGKRIGRLQVMSRADNRGHRVMWHCLCDCGQWSIVHTGNLTKARPIRSCGCLKREHAAAQMLRHGHARIGAYTPEYWSWRAMISRCTHSGHNAFANYGGRGITVCDRWLQFENFHADLGERPNGTSLDRIDNDGNYEPGNCRWATRKEQRSNRRDNK